MGTKMYISEFDSESKLRDNNAFELPSLNIFSPSNRQLMRGMDGLTIAMVNEGDILVTSEKLPEAYLDYWGREICSLQNYSPSATGFEGDAESISIYSRLAEDETARKMLKSSKIINYALVPEYYEMCEEVGIECEEPKLSLIRELNSKAYSNMLKEKFDLPAKGVRVRSIDEYEEVTAEMLKEHGSVIIKDVMGVSGRGMLLIESAKTAERITSHFKKQQEDGRTDFDFILEAALDRETDFSCLFQIDKEGRANIDAYQKNYSKGYAYLGTGPLEQSEYALISASDYSDTVMKIADDMARQGYHGYACIDSMISKGFEIIPLLEINPRMSVSRFNFALQEKIGRDCRLGYTEGKRNESGDTNTEKILKSLDDEGILYTRKRGKGVIPLAPLTWDGADAEGLRVRIYYVIAAGTQEEYEEILAAWLAHCSGSICAGRLT